jgi:hypothetical protein
MQTLHRLGTFLILIGLVLLILFAGSVISKDAKSSYLLVAIVALLVGLLLQRNKPASNDSGRFNAIRRASAASRQRREDKLNQRSRK